MIIIKISIEINNQKKLILDLINIKNVLKIRNNFYIFKLLYNNKNKS